MAGSGLAQRQPSDNHSSLNVIAICHEILPEATQYWQLVKPYPPAPPIIPFDCSTYRTVKPWKPEGYALRLQIGLEDVDDLFADLQAGLERLGDSNG